MVRVVPTADPGPEFEPLPGVSAGGVLQSGVLPEAGLGGGGAQGEVCGGEGGRGAGEG